MIEELKAKVESRWVDLNCPECNGTGTIPLGDPEDRHEDVECIRCVELHYGEITRLQEQVAKLEAREADLVDSAKEILNLTLESPPEFVDADTWELATERAESLLPKEAGDE